MVDGENDYRILLYKILIYIRLVFISSKEPKNSGNISIKKWFIYYLRLIYPFNENLK